MTGLSTFTLDLDELTWTGSDLARPESVVAQRDGQPRSRAGAAHDRGRPAADLGELRVLRRRGALWITCMTRETSWWPAAAAPRPDGFIVCVDERGPRVVADGIFCTNEARLDADGRYLYVAETMKARILRFPVAADGSLGEREVFGPDPLPGAGAFVDGFTFDAEGNLWVTTVVRNGIGILTPQGEWHVVVEDPSEAALRTVSTVSIGSLGMPALPTFRSPVPGLPMSHW